MDHAIDVIVVATTTFPDIHCLEKLLLCVPQQGLEVSSVHINASGFEDFFLCNLDGVTHKCALTAVARRGLLRLLEVLRCPVHSLADLYLLRAGSISHCLRGIILWIVAKRDKALHLLDSGVGEVALEQLVVGNGKVANILRRDDVNASNFLCCFQ